MGSDMHWVIKDVMERSHDGLIRTLEKVRDRLKADGPIKYRDLLADIEKALNNARVY